MKDGTWERELTEEQRVQYKWILDVIERNKMTEKISNIEKKIKIFDFPIKIEHNMNDIILTFDRHINDIKRKKKIYEKEICAEVLEINVDTFDYGEFLNIKNDIKEKLVDVHGDISIELPTGEKIMLHNDYFINMDDTQIEEKIRKIKEIANVLFKWYKKYVASLTEEQLYIIKENLKMMEQIKKGLKLDYLKIENFSEECLKNSNIVTIIMNLYKEINKCMVEPIEQINEIIYALHQLKIDDLSEECLKNSNIVTIIENLHEEINKCKKKSIGGSVNYYKKYIKYKNKYLQKKYHKL